jgi:hypothetical protein
MKRRHNTQEITLNSIRFNDTQDNTKIMNEIPRITIRKCDTQQNDTMVSGNMVNVVAPNYTSFFGSSSSTAASSEPSPSTPSSPASSPASDPSSLASV